jgi:hypothetical protein
VVCVSLFRFSNYLNNFQEIWHKPYVSGSYLKTVILNFLQTLWAYELGTDTSATQCRVLKLLMLINLRKYVSYIKAIVRIID